MKATSSIYILWSIDEKYQRYEKINFVKYYLSIPLILFYMHSKKNCFHNHNHIQKARQSVATPCVI